jgi:hypothetical protein
MLLLLTALAVAGGAFGLTRHHARVADSMSSDTRPRQPNGKIASATSLSVAAAIARRPAQPVAVHGYLKAAADDRPYLCARLNGYADCRGVPRLMIGGASHWLFVGRNRVRGLETGCCSIGSWSPHPVVLRGAVRGDTLLVVSP